jgi:small subunit ribosomal protein S2
MATPTALQKAERADVKPDTLKRFFAAGAHYGLARSRRHPSTMDYIYGLKDGIEIIDLEKTKKLLDDAKDFARSLGEEGGQILWATSKNEANRTIYNVAESIDHPHVTGRWIGGTLTNFGQIRSQVEKLEELETKKAAGELEKYTKKEQMLFDRQIDKLKEKFGGIRSLTDLPDAIFLVDTKAEDNALREARNEDVPVIGLCNVDCNIDQVDYPIVANDSSQDTIRIFTQAIRDGYADGADITL